MGFFNEGFTLSADTLKQAARFRAAMEDTGKQAGAILSGNEKETRFAYGMLAEGESTQSVWGTYLDAKRNSDTISHEDEARHINRLAGLENATAVSMAMAAVSDYSSGYDRTVAEWMDKPEDEIGQNRVYRELRRQGLSDHRARFIIGHTLGEKQAKGRALAGALRAYAASRLAGMTRTGEEGAATLIGQDTLINMGFDGVSNYLKKEEKSKK